MIVHRVFLSKLFFTVYLTKFGHARWSKLMDALVMVKLLSIIIPRSFPLETGVITFPKKEIEISLRSLRSSCCVPTIRNLVFSGLISSWFLQHQAATRLKSSSRTRSPDSASLTGKDKRNLRVVYVGLEIAYLWSKTKITDTNTKQRWWQYGALWYAMGDREGCRCRCANTDHLSSISQVTLKPFRGFVGGNKAQLL